MEEGNQVRTFEVGSNECKSLHDFICSEINPLLDRGWLVDTIRIENPEHGKSWQCMLKVVLKGSEELQA